MNIATQKNMAAFIDEKAFGAPITLTAGGAGDNTNVVGSTIDREGFSTGSLPLSMDFLVYFSATLTATKTLSLTLELDSSPDGAAWTSFATQAATVVATGPTGGGTVTGIARLTVAGNPGPGVSLASAGRFLRSQVTPDLSNTATDTATCIVIGVFGGFDSQPAPIN